MPRSNVETVFEVLCLFEENAFAQLVDLHEPDVFATAPPGWPEPGPFIGRETVMAQIERLGADWEAHEVAELKLVAESEDWVVVQFMWRVRSANGLDAEFPTATAYRVRNGRITECHFRWDSPSALEAAGLNDAVSSA